MVAKGAWPRWFWVIALNRRLILLRVTALPIFFADRKTDPRHNQVVASGGNQNKRFFANHTMLLRLQKRASFFLWC